jgi:hypothetical protein
MVGRTVKALSIKFKMCTLNFKTQTKTYQKCAIHYFFGLFNHIFPVSDGRMTDELERTWKEAVMAQLRYYYGICLDGLRETMKNLSGYPVSQPRLELSTSLIQVYSVSCL